MAKSNHLGAYPQTASGDERWSGYCAVYLRLALGAAFLSAVADRFGIWGAAGTPLVAWGDFHNFLLYAAKLNPWFPRTWIPTIGWIATLCELVFGVALIAGLRTRLAAFLSGYLTLAFAFGMAVGLGIKAPLNYSVFTASAASFLLASLKDFPWSLDA
ncbi:MAG: DoxX family protein, partial [Terriglobia bacterium]